MVIDIYAKEKKEQEKKAREKASGEEERETLTLKQIIADEDHSSLFSKMLEEKGADGEMIKRLVSAKLESADLDALEAYRETFEKSMIKVERIDEEMTPELVDDLTAMDKSFKKMVAKAGTEDVVKVVKERLGDLAMTDPARFEALSKKIEKMRSFNKDEVKKLDEQTVEACKKAGLNDTEFSKVLIIKDKKEMKQAMVKLIRDSWGEGFIGKGRRLLDLVTFKALSKSGSKTMLGFKGKMDGVLADLDKRKKDIARVLTATMKDNELMKEGLSKAILGEATKVEQIGFKDSSVAYPKMSEIDAKWEQHKNNIKRNNRPVAFDSLAPDQQQIEINKFGDELMAGIRRKKKKGFWSTIIEAVYIPEFTAKLSSLK